MTEIAQLRVIILTNKTEPTKLFKYEGGEVAIWTTVQPSSTYMNSSTVKQKTERKQTRSTKIYLLVTSGAVLMRCFLYVCVCVQVELVSVCPVLRSGEDWWEVEVKGWNVPGDSVTMPTLRHLSPAKQTRTCFSLECGNFHHLIAIKRTFWHFVCFTSIAER